MATLIKSNLGEIRVFCGLQLADVFSTLIFLSLGIAESNPLASYFMELFGPLLGLVILKSLAIGIALACNCAAHPKFLRGINWAYGAIVTLNLLTIIHSGRAQLMLGAISAHWPE